MIFLTGGTGFIGAHFLYHILSSGEEVKALKRPASDLNYLRKIFTIYTDDPDPLMNKIEWVEGEIDDYNRLYNQINKIDTIFHLAAMVSFVPSEKHQMLATNIRGTSNIVNIALEKNIPNLVYMSSVGALDPSKPGEQITEEHFANNPKRNSSYAESKFKSELEVWRGIEEGLNAVIVNPSIVLGPGIPNKGTGKLLDKIKKGLKYYPNGITGFVDVRDVCNTTLELFKKEYFNERFILNQGNYSYKKILELMSEAFGNNPPKKPLNPKLTSFGWKIEKIRTSLFGGKPLITKEIHNSANNKVHYSNNKIRETIGYQFIPIEKTIKDMVHFRLQKNRQTIKPAI